MQRWPSLLVALALAATSVPFLPAATADGATVTAPLPAEGDAWAERFHGFFLYEDDRGALFRDETYENGTGAHGGAGVAQDAYGDDHSAYAMVRDIDQALLFEARYDHSYYSYRDDAHLVEEAGIDLLTRDVLAFESKGHSERDSPVRWNVAPGVELVLPIGTKAVAERENDAWALFGRDLVHEGVQGRTLHIGDAWEYVATLNYLGTAREERLFFLVTDVDDAADPPRASVAVRYDPLDEPVREVVFEDGFPLMVSEEASTLVVGNSTDWETNETYNYRYEYGHSLVRTPLATGAATLPFGACIHPVHYYARNPHATFRPLGTEGPEDPTGVLPESVHDVLAEAEETDDPDLAEYRAWKAAHDDAWVSHAYFFTAGSPSLAGVPLSGSWSYWFVGLVAADGTGFELQRQRSGGFSFPPQDDPTWSAYESGGPALTPQQRADLELVSVDTLADAAAERGVGGDVTFFSFYVDAVVSTNETNETHVDGYAQMTLEYAEREDLGLSDDLTRGPTMSESRYAAISVDPLRGAKTGAWFSDNTYYTLAPMPPAEGSPSP